MLTWLPRFSCSLTILSGRSYTEQGGWPTRHADRDVGKTCLLHTTINDSTTTVIIKNGQPGAVGGSLGKVSSVQVGTVIQIGSEKMLVTANSAGTLTVTRGFASTTPAAATAGATVTVTTTGDGVIDIRGVSWGGIIFPTAWTAADLAVFVCGTRDGTFVPARDETGTLLQITTIATGASNQQYIPGKAFAGASYMKFRSITVGTDPTSAVNQGADRVLTFCGGE